MSTDQPKLSDFDDSTPALHEQVLADRGAAYSPSADTDAAASGNEPENVCLNCGADVSPQIARVLGDNNGNIPACAEPECREDVIVDQSLAVNCYRETARIVRAVRTQDERITTESAAGGRQ